MGGPAAGGALGPELPDLIILEVGVDEIAQGRPLGAKGARRRRRRAGRLTRVWPCADGWDPASRHCTRGEARRVFVPGWIGHPSAIETRRLKRFS